MEYQVITDHESEQFIEKVNNALKDGWTLQGGVSVAKPSPMMPFHYFQAMTKVKKAK